MTKPRGRPRRDHDAATQIVNFRCTAAQRLELRRVAEEAGVRLSTVIRDAVDEWAGDYREKVFRKTKI